nr:MAG TPA: hypothetical protein [Caudoviricetes sp.]
MFSLRFLYLPVKCYFKPFSAYYQNIIFYIFSSFFITFSWRCIKNCIKSCNSF